MALVSARHADTGFTLCFLDRSGRRAVGEAGGGDSHAGAVMGRGWGERKEVRSVEWWSEILCTSCIALVAHRI